MLWSDDLLKELSEKQQNGMLWPDIAQELSDKFAEPIHQEQLRGAVRRYRARQRVTEARLAQVGPALAADVVSGWSREARSIVPMGAQLKFRFGAVGDSHLCSNYEDLESLNRLYDLYAEEGIGVVYHTGNWIDGEAPFNLNDIHTRGMDAQIKYFVNTYPQRDGIVTQYVAGDDHEGWYTQKTGIDIGQHLEDMALRSGRRDLVYLGYMEADVQVALPDGSTLPIRVLHAGGGSSYALSHTSQKIVDSYDDAERPFILLVGHYHKAEYLPNYRGVKIIQTGTFQRQTPFMRKKRLHADLGGWIVDVTIVDERTTRVSAEFINFNHRPWRHIMG